MPLNRCIKLIIILNKNNLTHFHNFCYFLRQGNCITIKLPLTQIILLKKCISPTLKNDTTLQKFNVQLNSSVIYNNNWKKKDRFLKSSLFSYYVLIQFLRFLLPIRYKFTSITINWSQLQTYGHYSVDLNCINEKFYLLNIRSPWNRTLVLNLI